jgi:hypothetical protein
VRRKGGREMKIEKSFYFLLFFLFPVFIFGCAGRGSFLGYAPNKPDLSKHLATMNYQEFFGSDPEPGMLVTRDDLPKILQQDRLVRKINNAVNESASGKISKAIISKQDLIAMNKMLFDNFGGRQTNVEALTSNNKLFVMIIKYMMIYYTDEDGFIDREGTTHKPPDVKNGIGSDVISSTLGVFLEAFYDWKLDMPVFYDEKDQPMTKGHKVPTASRLGYARKEKIVSKAEKGEGITKYDLQVIRFLSGLAGDESKVFSGIIYRLFGSVQLGAVVIAGNFTIGGNDLLAKILDEIFMVTGRRTIERLSYEGYRKKSRMMAGTPAAILLANMEEISAKK